VAIAPVAKAKRLRQINWLEDRYPEVALGLGMKALQPLAPLMSSARNATLKFADYNVAIGELMRDRLEQRGAPPERIVVIPNWCDDEGIQPEQHTGATGFVNLGPTRKVRRRIFWQFGARA
jgi:colanic acid biosynthesis glycosyl transferase WcaI